MEKESFWTVKGVLLVSKTNRFERQKESFSFWLRFAFVLASLCLRCASDRFPLLLRCFFDCSSNPERIPNESRTRTNREPIENNNVV